MAEDQQADTMSPAGEQAILAELRAVRALLEVALSNTTRVSHLPPSLSRADRAALEHTLPAVAGRLGSEPFASRDLLEDESPALRLVLGDLNAKQLGRLSRRAEGHAIGGHVIQQVGTELRVILWRVLRVV